MDVAVRGSVVGVFVGATVIGVFVGAIGVGLAADVAVDTGVVVLVGVDGFVDMVAI